MKATATDSETSAGLVFTWAATGLPTGLSINHATGNMTGKPTQAGTYTVTVTATDNSNPTNSGSTTFTWTIVNLQPVITRVTPSSGPGAGGKRVKISGSNFLGVSSVTFGSVPATNFKLNRKGTKITATAPAEAAGTVDIVVTTVGGPSAPTAADHFTYTGPSITKVSPASGTTGGGTKVTVTGSGLTGASSVSFGSAPATTYSVNAGGTKITAVTPAGSPGSVDIVVVTPGGTTAITPADQFTYVAPAVTKVSPASGPSAGGNKVTITGTNLDGATGVSFGGVAATNVTVNAGGTKVTCTVPPGTGSVDVVVTTPGGSSATTPADTYTYA